MPFWVAPGTSSWMSILGRITNARTTCRRAAAAALAHGATGYLNTDWGDMGHLQQWVISEPGLAYGAAVSWCLATNGDLDLGAALSTHVFGDPTGDLAEAVLALGDAHLLVTPQFPNMSALVMNLYYPQLPVGRGLTAGLTSGELDAVDGCLDAARAAARRARPDRGDAALADRRGPLQHRPRRPVDRRRAGSPPRRRVPRLGAGGRAGPSGTPSSTRSSSATARCWLGRNRPGGLDDSLTLAAEPAGRLRIGSPGPTVGRPPGTGRRVAALGPTGRTTGATTTAR